MGWTGLATQTDIINDSYTICLLTFSNSSSTPQHEWEISRKIHARGSARMGFMIAKGKADDEKCYNLAGDSFYYGLFGSDDNPEDR